MHQIRHSALRLTQSARVRRVANYAALRPVTHSARTRKVVRSIIGGAADDKDTPTRSHAEQPVTRADVIKRFADVRPLLEIGPFDKPMVTGPGVMYFDVLDQAGLIEKAKNNPRRTGTPPHIDFVSPVGDLSVVDRSFSAVSSSHAIEHQPDLIKHLNDVADILSPSGFYFLAIPDKRFCFDHFCPESSIADVLEAHAAQRTVHSLASVVMTRGLSTHNDCRRHWAGDHEDAHYRQRLPSKVNNAIAAYDASKGAYVDVHAWRFTPSTFSEIITMLHELGSTHLSVVEVHETPEPRVEFMAILQKVPL